MHKKDKFLVRKLLKWAKVNRKTKVTREQIKQAIKEVYEYKFRQDTDARNQDTNKA